MSGNRMHAEHRLASRGISFEDKRRLYMEDADLDQVPFDLTDERVREWHGLGWFVLKADGQCVIPRGWPYNYPRPEFAGSFEPFIPDQEP